MKWLTQEKGIRYKLVGLHPEYKTQFYVFIDDENLTKALEEWKASKPSA
jgi:hypothetical protein